MSDEHEPIRLSRSDGASLDLVHVFAQGLPVMKPPVSKSPEPVDNSHHNNHVITVSRSDGLSHDIIDIIKRTSSVTKDESFKLEESSTRSRTLSISPRGSSYHPSNIRIVHMSDTHNCLLASANKRQFLPRGDILVHTGNFTSSGLDEEFAQFDTWLASVKDLYHYRVICIGSRDVKRLGNEWDTIRRKLPNATHVLCHEEAFILGLRFYGCPWHWGHKFNYSIRSGAPSSTTGRFEDIPEGVDVLLSHGPSYGRLDVSETGDHWGSRDLAEAVIRARVGVHLHGHIHESRGVALPFARFPLTLNSCLCDKGGEVMFACAHVIKCNKICMNMGEGNSMWHFSLDNLE